MSDIINIAYPSILAPRGDSALHLAARAGHLAVVKTLLARGGDLHARWERWGGRRRN